MAPARAPLQEGTPLSDRNSHVTAQAADIGGCNAVTETLSRIGDKWSMQVVIRLGEGPLRFNALRRAIDGISQRMLTRTVRGLERDGLISRTVTTDVPARVDYALTALGHSLWQPVSQVGAWALAHGREVEEARARYDAREST